jgi:acyl carrier protein
MSIALDEHAAVVARLIELIQEATDGAVRVEDAHGADSIRRLGLTSVTMLDFLVAVEDAYAIEWDDELDPAVLASFDAMAAHIVAERTAG